MFQHCFVSLKRLGDNVKQFIFTIIFLWHQKKLKILNSFFLEISTVNLEDGPVSPVQEIPIKATVLSAMSVVPYLLVLVALFVLDLTAVERAIAVRLLFQVLDVFRCPLTTLIIFASNKKQASSRQANVPSLSFQSQEMHIG